MTKNNRINSSVIQTYRDLTRIDVPVTWRFTIEYQNEINYSNWKWNSCHIIILSVIILPLIYLFGNLNN